MKVTVATTHFYSAINRLFSKHTDSVEVLPKNYAKIGYETDLLVFAGGEDVNPDLYGSSYRTYFSKERDEWEYDVLASMGVSFTARKVLGICRGLQMINVFRGGDLVTDLEDFYGKDHPYVHPIQDATQTGIANPFTEITMVNSMHHQGIRKGGRGFQLLSIEPLTKLPEICMWGENMLGMQFHPEFFDDDTEEKWKIAKIINEWVEGREFLPHSEKPSKVSRKFSTRTIASMGADWNPQEINIEVNMEEALRAFGATAQRVATEIGDPSMTWTTSTVETDTDVENQETEE